MSTPAQADNRENLEFKWVKKRGFGGKKKEVQFYESFIYDGVCYELYDCVYLCKEGEPEPYIGKIIKIWEIIQSKIRRVKILWFFRPCEIMNWLGEEQPPEDELFLACGEGPGVTNINPLEAISGKCNVVCISKDSRNPQPSEKDLQTADFKFYRMFDVQTCTIMDKIVKVALVEVESIFNKKDQSDSLGDPKFNSHGIPGHSAVRDMIAKEEEKGEGIAGKLLVSQVRDETKIKSLKNSDELDNRPLKKVKVADSTHLLEDNKLLDKRFIDSDRNNVSLVKAEDNVNKVLTQLEDEKKVKATMVMVEEKDKPAKVVEDGNIKKSANDVENGKKVNPKKNTNVGKVKSKEVVDDEKKGKPSKAFEDKKKGKSMKVFEDGKKEKPGKVFEDRKTTKPSKDIGDGRKVNLTKTTNELDIATCNKARVDGTSPQGVGKFDRVSTNHVEDGMNEKSKNDMDELETRPLKKLRLESSTKSPMEKKDIEDHKLTIPSNGNEMLAKEGKDTINEVHVYRIKDHKKLNASRVNVSIKQDQSSTIKNSRVEGCVEEGSVKQVVEDEMKSKFVKNFPQIDTYLLKKTKLDKETSKLSTSKLLKVPPTKPPSTHGKLGNQIICVTRRPDADKSRWFKGIPWEERMKDAHKNGVLVLLENLDPTYTSAEVEDIVWHGFKVSCASARTLERTAISSPNSGRAFVIFKTKEAAEKVVRRLEEDCLVLPNGRVLVGSIGTPCFPVKGSSIVGHFALDKQRVQMPREMKEAVSTSHCSQGNTIEYEMAMEWFLLQERFQRCWEKLYQVQGEEWKRACAKLSSK